jgi:hypothetical protein
VHFGGIVNQCAIHSQIASQFTATINIEAHTFCAPIGLGYYTNLVVAISLLERIALEQSNQILHKGTGIAGMLPIPVPVGSWRFPTDNFSELNAPFFDNEGIVWGPPTEGLSPLAYQVSLDIYNQWCEHAYGWVAICNHLQDVDFQQAKIWGFEYRGPHNYLSASLSNHSPEREASLSASDPIASSSQHQEQDDEDIISKSSDTSPAAPED